MNPMTDSKATCFGMQRIGRRVIPRDLGLLAFHRLYVDGQGRNGACDIPFKLRFELQMSMGDIATGKSAMFPKDLEGERSPGRPECFRAGNSAGNTTNPTCEQRLEVVETARGQGLQ